MNIAAVSTMIIVLGTVYGGLITMLAIAFKRHN